LRKYRKNLGSLPARADFKKREKMHTETAEIERINRERKRDEDG
jgi:hypothetical protein